MSWARSHGSDLPMSPTRRSTTMNLITDVVAGLAHFLGWLV
ncbi:hypothetical protein ACFVYR_35325 [Streptomyces sp. NPDC058284]